jgi:hypothetical protein
MNAIPGVLIDCDQQSTDTDDTLDDDALSTAEQRHSHGVPGGMGGMNM